MTKRDNLSLMIVGLLPVSVTAGDKVVLGNVLMSKNDVIHKTGST